MTTFKIRVQYFIAHITRVVPAVDKRGEGDDWEVWLGSAPSEEGAVVKVNELLDEKNEGIEPTYQWVMQTIEPLEIGKLLHGEMVQVSQFFYTIKNPANFVIKMVQATDKEVEAFAKEVDICPELDDDLDADEVYGDIDPCLDCDADTWECEFCFELWDFWGPEE